MSELKSINMGSVIINGNVYHDVLLVNHGVYNDEMNSPAFQMFSNTLGPITVTTINLYSYGAPYNKDCIYLDVNASPDLISIFESNDLAYATGNSFSPSNSFVSYPEMKMTDKLLALLNNHF